ncbi:hypothetical protein BHE74_00043972 [Ensete ventricosum]|nr:hypothetical protein BHE74_00043972 [Ensete ventricosum]RZS17952.1 hypothetical protein BHM03_00050158 [Ensete ventricosum]
MVIYKFGYGDSRESKILTCVLKVRHQVNDFSELRRRTSCEKERRRRKKPSVSQLRQDRRHLRLLQSKMAASRQGPAEAVVVAAAF